MKAVELWRGRCEGCERKKSVKQTKGQGFWFRTDMTPVLFAKIVSKQKGDKGIELRKRKENKKRGRKHHTGREDRDTFGGCIWD